MEGGLDWNMEGTFETIGVGHLHDNTYFRCSFFTFIDQTCAQWAL